jgi:excisionase family DNA binding protein
VDGEMKEISGSLQEIFGKFLFEYFEGRVLLDSFDMIFGMIEQELRKIDASDDKLAVLDNIRQAYDAIIESLNLRRKEDKELFLPLNIKYSTWERYWQETIRAKREGLYSDFAYNFDLIEKYVKSELAPFKAIEYLRWVYSKVVSEFRSTESSEALKLKLLNLIDDLELNLDNRRSRISPDNKNDKKTILDKNGSTQPELRYIDNKSAAEYLHITPVTLWRLRKASKIPFTKVGKKLLFSIDDLDEYLKTELISERISKTVMKTVIN